MPTSPILELPDLRKRVNISRALDIMGWMEPNELEWLAFEARRHSVIVEVGSYLGRSSRALADNTHGVVYCVDHWRGPKEFKDDEQPFPPEMLFDTFLGNTKDLRESKKLFPVRCDSLKEATRRLECGYQADMVFIDASHDLESVRQDILAWSKVLKVGGLLCGHDAHWPGVAEARRLLLPEHIERGWVYLGSG